MCRADAKAGLSEPMLPRRRGNDQEIKATPGITGWYYPSVHSDDSVRHLNYLKQLEPLLRDRGAIVAILYLEPLIFVVIKGNKSG